MLKSINYIYLLLSILLYAILSPKISGEYLLINFVSVLTFIIYYTILVVNSSIGNEKFYKRNNLGIEVFVYSLLFITLNNIISYYYNNNFFLFSDDDAYFYHIHTVEMINMPLSEMLNFYLGYMGLDDLGIILILYPLYHIVESNLILNLFYLFVNVITALSLFRLGKNFMTNKYAFLASLSYTLSSFVLFHHSIGLKESFMVMLVVLSFDFYYRFIKSKNPMQLVYALIFMSLLIFFRPAVSIIIIVSIALASLVSKKRGIAIKIISFLMIIFLISIKGYIFTTVDKYTAGGYEMLMYARETQGMIIGSIPFTYAVNALAQMIGPLPTLIPSENIKLAFYAPGLIYRVLLAFPFWLGVVYIYKTKSYLLYPLMLFAIIEMIVLVFIMEGLELRKALPHIPIVFVIAFWFLDMYDRRTIKFRRRKRLKLFFKASMVLLAIIIFYWNLR